jgi:hypothetical protein
MESGSPVRPVEVSKKIILKERKGKERKRKERKGKGYKPCIKSHKSVIFLAVVGAEPLARSQ